MNTSISKKWFCRNVSAIALTAVIAILFPAAKVMASDNRVVRIMDHTANAKTGLVVVTLGIKDEGNDDWVGIASNLGPVEDRWVIKQTGAPTYFRRRTHVPLDNVIAIPANAGHDQIQTLLAPIAKAPNAVVIVNMDPGAAAMAMTKAGGRISPRRWAARVVGLLAQEHLTLFPASQMTWIGHGEGAEPMAMVPDKGQGTRRHLFDRMVAMSPSVITAHYPRRTVVVVADGDAPFRRFRGSSNGAAAKVIASMGYRVVRIMDQALKAGFSSPARSALTAASCGALIGYGGARFMSGANASASVTQAAPSQVVYYSPATAAPTQMQANTLGSALTTVTNNDSETNIVNNGPTTNVSNETTNNVDNESTTNTNIDNSIYNAPEEPEGTSTGPEDNPTGPEDVYADPAPGDDDTQFGNFQPMTLTAPVIEPDDNGGGGTGGGAAAEPDDNGGGGGTGGGAAAEPDDNGGGGGSGGGAAVPADSGPS